MNHYGTITHQTITDAETWFLRVALGGVEEQKRYVVDFARAADVEELMVLLDSTHARVKDSVRLATALRTLLISLPENLTEDVLSPTLVLMLGDALHTHDWTKVATVATQILGGAKPPSSLPEEQPATATAPAVAPKATDEPSFEDGVAEADDADPLPSFPPPKPQK